MVKANCHYCQELFEVNEETGTLCVLYHFACANCAQPWADIEDCPICQQSSDID